MITSDSPTEAWPPLVYEEWKDTLHTLHMWTQVAGKIRLALAPMMNHWWQVPLYVSTRGLTTSPMPLADSRTFAIDFDFVDHALRVHTCDGEEQEFPLAAMPVAAFYRAVMDALHSLRIDVSINTMPCEVADAIPFERDVTHASYDPGAAHRFWRVLVQADRLCKRFRAGFTGKASPVHFFWGSFDLAVTRFSGRPAPPHPGGIPNVSDAVTREAYSREESSAGFWPGGSGMEASFYSYAYPEPNGFAQARVEPSAAAYSDQLKEFVLPYDAVRRSSDRDAALLAFFQSTYDAAANLGHWDRASLER